MYVSRGIKTPVRTFLGVTSTTRLAVNRLLFYVSIVTAAWRKSLVFLDLELQTRKSSEGLPSMKIPFHNANKLTKPETMPEELSQN